MCESMTVAVLYMYGTEVSCLGMSLIILCGYPESIMLFIEQCSLSYYCIVVYT